MTMDDWKFHSFKDSVDLQDFDLQWILLSAPNGIANLGQLSLDLIIANCDMERIGWIETPYVAPFSGNDALAGDLTTAKGQLHYACEVFLDKSGKVLCVHLRSPVFPAAALHYAKAICRWISLMRKSSKVVLLSGADGTQIDDSILARIQSDGLGRLRVLSSPDLSSEHEELAKALQALSLSNSNTIGKRQFVSDTVGSTIGSKEGEFSISRWILPGTGLGRVIFELLSAHPVFRQPCLFPVLYVVEGDNSEDAKSLAKFVLSLIAGTSLVNVKVAEKLKVPLSWSNLYGENISARELY